MTTLFISRFFHAYRPDAVPSIHLPNASQTNPRRRIVRPSSTSPPRKRRTVQQQDEDQQHQDEVEVPEPSALLVVETTASVQTELESQEKETQTPSNAGTIKELRTKIRKLEKQLKQRKYSFLNVKASRDRLLRKMMKKKGQSKECQKCQRFLSLPSNVIAFIEEQIVVQMERSTGMRWSESTVKMGQCVLYKSPACYYKLQQFFSLPSTKCLYRRSPNTAKQVS